MPQTDARLTGRSLVVDGVPCRRLEIEPDPSLRDAVAFSARYADPAEFEALRIEQGRDVLVTTRAQVSASSLVGRLFPGGLFGGARGGKSRKVTLELVLRVPPGFPLEIGVGGEARVRIGPVSGPLTLDLSGSVGLDASEAAPLILGMSGQAEARIGAVALTGEVEASGSARATLRQVAVERLSVEGSGDASVEAGPGTVGSLVVEAHGACGVVVSGTVFGSAEVEASGAAQVRLAQVSGRVAPEVSGAARVTVAGKAVGRPARG